MKTFARIAWMTLVLVFVGCTPRPPISCHPPKVSTVQQVIYVRYDGEIMRRDSIWFCL